MRLLVLGGSGFVGRAVVDDAVARGWTVTTFNRGLRGLRGGAPVAGVETLHGDRLDPASLSVLSGREWDAVVDTWSGIPRAVRDSARVLRGRVGTYAYVSSRSVYAPPVPPGADESAPVLPSSPDAEDGDYGAQKAGGELAALQAFGDDALIARAGLILGPYEDVGRLPWWLARAARGGPMLAPGPSALPIQYIDARDIAAWLVSCVAAGTGGVVNTVSRPGYATMGSLLDAVVTVTGGAATLRWVDPEPILAAGVVPWNDLPVWIPPGHEFETLGLHSADASRAEAAGLRPRPIENTVADTWAWLRSIGGVAPQRPDRPPVGLDPDVEAAILATQPR
ncbi:NAD-dependent epimerase/dehydratase family protein [Jiangella rhizosphaerae]|uniref:NAD-dependent epimerase/dehydratase family protein n=1 Tax=Jiangella rhizosphaerae TaxID=2293569 RepID=A0A418KLW2_9ACTN|nr:NAD-dependent epimerase/dehydratase family protein [Jiangella rhizosphaerae]RIQ18913.1 NAD-dependent epimerase/dehydratase family protein [Jiangella rhizosphaerae]